MAPSKRDSAPETSHDTERASGRASGRNWSGDAGWKSLFFSVAIACIAGLWIRLYFNPDRIRNWLDEALAEQGASLGLKFAGARLELSRGSIPQLAIELTGVEAHPAGDCDLAPSIRVARLRVPISFTAALKGRVAIGTVSAENMSIDLDGLKERCPAVKPDAEAKAGPRLRDAAVDPVRAVATASADGVPATPWWTEPQLTAISEFIDGFEFSKVELLFENKTKKVYLEAFDAWPSGEPGVVKIETDLVLPPELTYGERLPSFTIKAVATGDQADVSLNARMSEGGLQASARLKPSSNRSLTIETRLAFSNVPLSTVVPLLTKAGIVQGTFRPRFMWLDCQVSIHGKFQGLFNHNPLRLEQCEIKGNGARIALANAVRRPDGQWEPFSVGIDKLPINRLMDTFGWQGPDGVFTDFGQLSGEIRVASPSRAELSAVIEGAQLRASNRNVRAQQTLQRLSLRLGVEGEVLEGHIDKVEVAGGQFDGEIGFKLDKRGQEGRVNLALKKLRLSEPVSLILFGGALENVSGKAEGRLERGRLAALKGQLVFDGLSGKDFRFRSATAQTELGKDGEFQVNFRTPELQIRRDSTFFESLRPLFFSHVFATEWVLANETLIRAVVPAIGGLRWDSAQATLENGRIKISSSGAFNRERVVSGWVNTDYPSIKRLRWALSGTTDQPTLREDSKALSDVLKRAPIQDVNLGLPRNGASQIEQNGLKALSDRLLKNARAILPTADSAQMSKDKESTKPAPELPASPSASP